MAVDPAAPATSIDLTPVVAPIIAQAVHTATADLAMRLAALEQQAATAATAVVTQLEPSVITAGAAVLTNVEQDPLTQRIVVCLAVGALLLAGLAILGFALLGNATANRWIAGAPVALGAVVLWISKVGVSLPKPLVKEVAP